MDDDRCCLHSSFTNYSWDSCLVASETLHNRKQHNIMTPLWRHLRCYNHQTFRKHCLGIHLNDTKFQVRSSSGFVNILQNITGGNVMPPSRPWVNGEQRMLISVVIFSQLAFFLKVAQFILIPLQVKLVVTHILKPRLSKRCLISLQNWKCKA